MKPLQSRLLLQLDFSSHLLILLLLGTDETKLNESPNLTLFGLSFSNLSNFRTTLTRVFSCLLLAWRWSCLYTRTPKVGNSRMTKPNSTRSITSQTSYLRSGFRSGACRWALSYLISHMIPNQKTVRPISTNDTRVEPYSRYMI